MTGRRQKGLNPRPRAQLDDHTAGQIIRTALAEASRQCTFAIGASVNLDVAAKECQKFIDEAGRCVDLARTALKNRKDL